MRLHQLIQPNIVHTHGFETFEIRGQFQPEHFSSFNSSPYTFSTAMTELKLKKYGFKGKNCMHYTLLTATPII